jgi:hypothetical protein
MLSVEMNELRNCRFQREAYGRHRGWRAGRGLHCTVANFVQTVAVAGAAGSAGVGALPQMLTAAEKALIHDD